MTYVLSLVSFGTIMVFFHHVGNLYTVLILTGHG